MQAVELREVLPAALRRVAGRSARTINHRTGACEGETGGGEPPAGWDEPAPGGEATTVGGDEPPAVANAPARGAEGLPSGRDDDRGQEGSIQSTPLWKKLLVMFGHGERPELRIALFQRVDRLCTERGKDMVVLVREAITGAKGRRQPAHYFCRAIRAKISEAGFLEELP